jgi:hypothetical protein
MAQITYESDKVYAIIRELRRFTAGSIRMHKPSTLIEAMSLAALFEGAFKSNSALKGSKRAADFKGHSRDGKRTKPSAFHVLFCRAGIAVALVFSLWFLRFVLFLPPSLLSTIGNKL